MTLCQPLVGRHDAKGRTNFPEHLCPKCEQLLDSLLEFERQGRSCAHYNDFEDVIASAKLGCYICHSLVLAWENRDNSHVPKAFSKLFVVYSQKEKKDDPAFILSLSLYPHSDSIPNEYQDPDQLDMTPPPPGDVECLAWISVWIRPENLEEQSIRKGAVAPAGSTTDQASMDTARSWLDMCLSTHERCNNGTVGEQRDEATMPHWYPSRLLKLTISNNGITVRLQECGKEPPSGAYVSLSHRWGGAKVTTLTKENICSMKAGIICSDLPKTFQDAVKATLQLGYNYLWIDSLCILQDSDADWRREASTMQEVYSNSLFTISATSPRAVDEGLASTRFTDHVGLLTRDVRYRDEPGKPRTSKITFGLWDAIVAHAPVSRRGWVLQERLLSQRILHFASSQLVWECDELMACQTHPAGTTGLEFETDEYRHRFRDTLAKKLPRRQDQDLKTETPHEQKTRKEIYHSWWKVVQSYSRGSLTKPHDKLIALSGIASYYQELTGDRYLAGLWSGAFVDGLLWWSAGGSRSRPKDYRAPSWSWAAIDGAVNYTCSVIALDVEEDVVDNLEWTAELLEFDIALLNANDATGLVQGGSATLEGKLTPLFWGPASRHLRSVRTSKDTEPLNRHNPWAFKDVDEEHNETVYCLILRRYKGPKTKGLGGIIIYEVEHQSSSPNFPRKYQRMGCLSVNDEEAEDVWIHSEDAVVSLI